MSPEQAAGDLDRLGLPADVYSLGATLYCLLTGRAPFADRDVVAVLAKVRRGEFPPPRAVNRAIDPALEAICLKAMALVPEGRYASPVALADDIEHWLADEPVSAWREPFSILARRWMRRNRTLVASMATALVAGVIGLSAVAVVQSRANSALEAKNLKLIEANAATNKAKNETDTALAETTKARRATEEALAQKAALAQSEESRQSAEAVLTFLKDDVLAATRPEGQEGGLGREVTVRKAVDRRRGEDRRQIQGPAGRRGGRPRTPWVRRTYYLGDPPLAIRQFERALELRESKLGPDHPDTLQSRNNLAAAYRDAGRIAEAITHAQGDDQATGVEAGPRPPRHAHQPQQPRHRPISPPAAPPRPSRCSRRRSSCGRRSSGPTIPTRSSAAITSPWPTWSPAARPRRSSCTKRRSCRGRRSSAPTTPRRSPAAIISLWPIRPPAARAEAIKLHEETLKLRERKLGPDHHDTLVSRSNLTAAYLAAGRIAEAEPLLRDSLERARKQFGPADPRTAGAMAQLGLNLIQQRQWSAAEPVLRECLAVREKIQPDDWSTFNTRSQLGGSLMGQKKYAAAEPLILAGYEGMKAREAKIPTGGKPRLTDAERRVVRLYEGWGKLDHAKVWREKLGLADLPAEVFARP